MAWPSKLNDEHLAMLWSLRHEGNSLQAIAMQLNVNRVSVFLYLEKHGGYQPAARKRAKRHLSAHERESIRVGLSEHKSYREIGTELGRSASTICREVNRNGGRSRYRATTADNKAWQRARRPKRCRLLAHRRLCRIVADRLGEDWSPEQISNWLRKVRPDEPDLHVSHETIYRTLFIQSRGALRKELRDHLRTRRRFREARAHTRKGITTPIMDGVSISERPADVEDRAVPGHWEGDLIEGLRHTCIATLVERKTRFVILVRVPSKHTAEVTAALAAQMKSLPERLQRTLTWDRGSEMAAHKQFSLSTNIDVYFCDPKSPWQRGSNENTNGLLRQYFPKGTDLSGHAQEELDRVADMLNTRPRKTLGYETPAYMLAKELGLGVASTD